jgi:hypothetical protein
MLVNEQAEEGGPDPDTALPSQEGEGMNMQNASTVIPTSQAELGLLDQVAPAVHTLNPLTTRPQSPNGDQAISGPLLEASLDVAELAKGDAPVSNGAAGGEMNDFDALNAILTAGHNAISANGYEVSGRGANPQIQHVRVPEHDGNDLPSVVPLYPSQSSITDIAFLDSAGSVADSEVPRIQAFAKLEFDDGQFYMNTYSVELGRDIRAARAAFQHGFGSSHPSNHRHKRSSSSGDGNQPPRRLRHGGSRNMESSVVSETGGIIGVDVSEEERKKKLYKKKTKSTSSSSHYPSRKNSTLVAGLQTDYQSLAMASLADPHGIDALTFLPSPEECPLIPIHPPAVAEGSNTGHRGISRRHVRIAYNFERRLFEMEILGKNGAFMDEQYYAPGEIQELKSGSYIQIGGVGVRFVLPDVAIGETGAEGGHGAESIVGSAMSFDFEDGRGESIRMAESVEPSTSDDEDSLRGYNREAEQPLRNRKLPVPESSSSSSSGDDEEEDEEDEDEDDEGSDEQEEPMDTRPKRQTLRLTKPAKPAHEPKGRGKSKPKPEPVPETPIQPPKRKGPGRPPKNGIISKREQALLARQAREAAKAEALKKGLIKPPKTMKPDKPADTMPLPPDVKPEKRKYTKRRPKTETQPTEQGQVVQESIEKTDSLPPAQPMPEQPPKPVKEKRPPKPPRSPSPVFDEATLTPEQLAKPSQSYVVLIHEALTNSKTGAMSLPQIYRAIERRYPYYKLRVTTTGWQSSVRHNLSQHPAFRKIERDGKGWMWGLVPEISIEKEKKRRPSPPPMPPQQYYQQGGPHMYRHPYPYPGMPPPPNGLLPPMNHPYGINPGMPPPPPGYPLNHVGIPRGINGIPLPLAPQRDAASTYQSPYQPPSQPAAPQPIIPQQQTQQPGNTDGAADPTPSSQPPPTNSSNQHTDPPATTAPPQTPSETSLPTSTEQPNPMGQPILEMVGIFKKVLIASLAELPHAGEVVTNAINRTLGIAPPANTTVKEYPEEAVIMKTLAKMLETAISNERAQRQASQAAQSPSTSQLAASSMSPPIPAQSEPPPAPTESGSAQPAVTENLSLPGSTNPPLTGLEVQPHTFAPHNAETQNKLLALLQQLGPSSTNDANPIPPPDASQIQTTTEPATDGSRPKLAGEGQAGIEATEAEMRAKSLKRELEDDNSSEGSTARADKHQDKRIASGVF